MNESVAFGAGPAFAGAAVAGRSDDHKTHLLGVGLVAAVGGDTAVLVHVERAT